MQAVLSENTTRSSLRASEEIARHCTADVLVGNYSGQNPHALPTKASTIRISSQALSRSRTKEQGRNHIDESPVQKPVRDAVVKAGLTKRAACHTFRHSFATHLLEAGYDIRTAHSVAFPPSFPRKGPSKNATTLHCVQEERKMAFNFALQGTISSRVDFGRHPNKAISRPWEHSWKVPFAGMTPRAELPARDPVDRYRYLNVRELLGNDDVKTTMIYTHVLYRGPAGVCSPVDRL